MSVRVILWIAIGIATGVTHAVSLWRSAHAHGMPEFGVVWRLPLVAAVLVFAALTQGLIPAVLGWAAGLAAASVVYLVRTRRWM